MFNNFLCFESSIHLYMYHHIYTQLPPYNATLCSLLCLSRYFMFSFMLLFLLLINKWVQLVLLTHTHRWMAIHWHMNNLPMAMSPKERLKGLWSAQAWWAWLCQASPFSLIPFALLKPLKCIPKASHQSLCPHLATSSPWGWQPRSS